MQTPLSREEYCRRMRILFSCPDVVNADGSIYQEYYKPVVDVRIRPRAWGDADRMALAHGLAEYSVGKWSEIIHRYLPLWVSESESFILVIHFV